MIQNRCFISVDIGGTKIGTGVFTFSGGNRVMIHYLHAALKTILKMFIYGWNIGIVCIQAKSRRIF